MLSNNLLTKLLALAIIAGLVLIGGYVSGKKEPYLVRADTECLVYVPTSTPVPLHVQYSQWMPYPGYGPNMGKGWIRIRDYNNVIDNIVKLRNVKVLSDEEYNAIGKEHGLRIGRWDGDVYGFPPVKGFGKGYPVIKNEWLPWRFR